MERFLRVTAVFVLAYVAFMVPTYVLPYFGSTSSVASVVGAAFGGGGGLFPPQWWAHVFALAVLVVLAWVRGSVLAGRGYLPWLVVAAALFDLVPVIRAIPFVPTVLHLVVLVLGITGRVVPVDVGEVDSAAPVRAKWRSPLGVLAGVTAVCVAGAVWSVVSITSNVNQRQADIASKLIPMAAPGLVVAPVAAPVVKPGKVVPEGVVKLVPMAPVVATPVVAAPAVVDKPVVKVASAVDTGAVADILADGQRCFASKRFDCAISQAKSALRLDAGNGAARSLLAKAQAGQKAALDGIEIR